MVCVCACMCVCVCCNIILVAPCTSDIPSLPADALPKPEELIVELDALEKKLKCVSPATSIGDFRAHWYSVTCLTPPLVLQSDGGGCPVSRDKSSKS